MIDSFSSIVYQKMQRGSRNITISEHGTSLPTGTSPSNLHLYFRYNTTSNLQTPKSQSHRCLLVFRRRQTSQADGDDSVWTYDPDATRQKNGVPRRRKMQSQGALQGSVEPLLGSDRTGADSTGATTPLKSSIAGKNSPSSQPSSSVNDSDFSSGSPRTPRRTKVNDGKIYENVDGGIDIESSI